METSRQAVEKNLSEIAFASLAEKSPSLMDYYLGFDLVEKNDSGTRAAGIMGFKIGKQLVYVPVFFLNGKLKGTEVMYLKNSDIFVSNSEQWVSYIIGQAQGEMGDSEDPSKASPDAGEVSQALALFSRPPTSASKTASGRDIAESAIGGAAGGAAVGAVGLLIKKLLSKNPEPAPEEVQPSVILAQPSKEDIAQLLAQQGQPPEFKSKTASIEDFSTDTIENFIDIDLAIKPLAMDLPSFIKKAGPAYYKKIAAVLTQDGVWENVVKIHDPKTLMIEFAEEKVASVEVEDKSVKLIRISDSMEDKIASTLTSDEKGQLFTDGYIIKNAVEGKDATKMYIEDEKDSFQEVTESGLYKILNKSGDLVEAFVFVGPVAIDAIGTSRGGSTSKLVLASGSKNYIDTLGEVFYRSPRETKKVTDKKDIDLLTDGAKSFDSLAVNNTYLLVGDNFSVYGPFRVSNKSKDNGKATITVRQSYCCCGGSYNPVNLRKIDLDRATIDRAGDTVYIPNNYKFIEVSENGYDKDNNKVDIRPGDFTTVIDALTSKGGLKAIFEKRNGDLISSIEGKTASFRNRGDFVFYLCDTVKLPVVSAEKVASKLIDGGRPFKAVFMPKQAEYPEVVDPDTASGSTVGGTPQEVQAGTTQEMIPAGQPQVPATDPMFQMWDQADPQDMALLQRAADANSREVFDPAMIGILTRTTRAGSIVQEYIPEFIDNLDRMIRLLLLFYWHNAEFAKNYGIDEMADFEDLLLSTIKSTGKTILFLKQKSVEGSSRATDALG